MTETRYPLGDGTYLIIEPGPFGRCKREGWIEACTASAEALIRAGLVTAERALGPGRYKVRIGEEVTEPMRRRELQEQALLHTRPLQERLYSYFDYAHWANFSIRQSTGH